MDTEYIKTISKNTGINEVDVQKVFDDIAKISMEEMPKTDHPTDEDKEKQEQMLVIQQELQKQELDRINREKGITTPSKQVISTPIKEEMTSGNLGGTPEGTGVEFTPPEKVLGVYQLGTSKKSNKNKSTAKDPSYYLKNSKIFKNVLPKDKLDEEIINDIINFNK
jgi:hypothetical protein